MENKVSVFFIIFCCLPPNSVLTNITGALVNVDSYRFHESQDGQVDQKKYDLLDF